jgi:hypothetical protein
MAKIINLTIAAAAILIMLSGHKALAASQAADGLTVSPAFQMVTIASNAAEQPVSFSITNNRPVAQDVSFSVADFNTLNESGGLFFVGTNPTALQKKYGLAKWISLPTKNLVIQPMQTISLKASVLNLPTLQAGGHYGALMISLGGTNAQAGQVGIQPIASSLLFVTKPQGATHKLDLSNVYVSHSLFELPTSATLRFKNDGNTHVVPRGSVYMSTPGGKVISKGIINENSEIILPENFRKYNVALRQVDKSNAVGRYTLHVDFRFDGIDQVRSYQQSFIILTLRGIVVAVLGLLAVSALLYFGLSKYRSRSR